MHSSMFRDTIRFFGNDEQYAKWMPMVENLDIHGCYAQTELGHGSDVSRLETTATFDPESDEFVIHTPTNTATKWWPGEMGRYATHASVFARLIIHGNFYGVCPFIVQIRDINTHKHLPGI